MCLAVNVRLVFKWVTGFGGFYSLADLIPPWPFLACSCISCYVIYQTCEFQRRSHLHTCNVPKIISGLGYYT